MDPLFSIWWGFRISYTMINYVMHICVEKSLEFSYHMFNCNCCEIWWMFFLWTLFVQLNNVANLIFACRFKMGYFCFNLAIAPHTVQLNECARSTLESIRQSYWNRWWYTADRKRFAALLRVRRFSRTVCDIALSHTRTGSERAQCKIESQS